MHKRSFSQTVACWPPTKQQRGPFCRNLQNTLIVYYAIKCEKSKTGQLNLGVVIFLLYLCSCTCSSFVSLVFVLDHFCVHVYFVHMERTARQQQQGKSLIQNFYFVCVFVFVCVFLHNCIVFCLRGMHNRAAAARQDPDPKPPSTITHPRFRLTPILMTMMMMTVTMMMLAFTFMSNESCHRCQCIVMVIQKPVLNIFLGFLGHPRTKDWNTICENIRSARVCPKSPFMDTTSFTPTPNWSFPFLSGQKPSKLFTKGNTTYL